MTDHYALAEQALAKGKLTAAIAHSLLALVEEFRKPEPIEYATADHLAAFGIYTDHLPASEVQG